MTAIERLVTVVDLEDHDPTGHSAWAHLYAALSSRERLLLFDGRGWSGSAEIAEEGLRQIQDTARMVTGPDGPGSDETEEQMQAQYWQWMQHKLRAAGICAVSVSDG